MAEDWAYFEGDYVPISKANVSIRTHALNYGTGCFEGIRGYWNEEHGQIYLFRVREHFERLHRSARALRMSLKLSLDELVEIAVNVVARNGFETDVYVRPVVYKSGAIIGLSMVRREGGKTIFLPDDFFLFAAPLGDYLDLDEPIRCCISTWQRIDDNVMPARTKATGLYLNSSLAKTEAEENGFDEGIMLTSDGHVSEGSGENLFIVRDGVLITPTLADNILEGITRSTLIQLAKDELGVDTVERQIDRSELYVADELFLCGTGAQVAAVGEVDHRPIADGRAGPITSQLMKLYFDIVKGKNPKYADWCTAVYTTQVAAASR